jgi:AbrB family looped-hinge helix DNA binding protein
MATVTVSSKGWVVIPAELRRKYGWKPGHRVRVVDYGGVISLMPVLRNPEDEGMGILKGPGGSLLTELKRERAKERRRDQRWK